MRTNDHRDDRFLTALKGGFGMNGEPPQEPPPPIDDNNRTGDDEGMEKRVTQLELAVGRIDQTLSFMRENMVTKADVADLRTEIAKGDGDIKSEVQKGITETQRWMFATVIGLFLGFGGLFLAMSNALKPMASATSPSVPAVVYLPQTGLATAPAQPSK